jgi:hypothetical protein
MIKGQAEVPAGRRRELSFSYRGASPSRYS